VGSPTGGDRGAGTINVAGDIYKNNTAYTNPDYVFEKFYTGDIVRYASTSGASTYQGLRALTDLEAFTHENWYLPLIGRDPSGAFSRFDMLLASMEESYLYLFNHEHRLKALEASSNLKIVLDHDPNQPVEAENIAGLNTDNGLARSALAGDPILGVFLSDISTTSATSSLLASLGRASVKVSLESGPISIGDPLTVGSEPGVAKRATEPGPIVGYALESFTSTSTISSQIKGKILVFVNPGFWFPSDTISALRATSTQPDTSGSLDFILEGLKQLGVSIEQGIVRMKDLIVDTITARRARVNDLEVDQVQLKDQDTNAPYCVRIKSGALLASPGECAAESPSDAPPAAAPPLPGSVGSEDTSYTSTTESISISNPGSEASETALMVTPSDAAVPASPDGSSATTIP
jgi:hypothetical protein